MLVPSLEVTKIELILVKSIYKTNGQDSLETQRRKAGHLATAPAVQTATDIPLRGDGKR